MQKLFQDMARLLSEKKSLVVATIISSDGSAPRTAGAKMAVGPDGTIYGTIGGGQLEAEAISRAGDVFRSGKGFMYPFSLKGEDVAGMDMICGGSGEVLLDFVDAEAAGEYGVYQAAAEVLAAGENAWLLTFLEGERNGRHSLVKADGSMIGCADGDIHSWLEMSRCNAVSLYREPHGGRRVLVEPLRRAGLVYIFGAGHVSQKLAPLCETVGFKTAVLDDRAEFADSRRFPEAAAVRLIETFGRLPELPVDEDSYMVIVTRGHLHDEAVLAQALRTAAGYIGMIGSRRKRDKLYSSLEKKGFRPEDFARVHSPIGTDIGAETPEEIAVSIVGELIKVRAERRGVPRKCR
ncbi:MAG TPA: XdhC family protein [Selenomonadales bacterium]|nr:XdhC family protein [Selenomonadales bacterium]